MKKLRFLKSAASLAACFFLLTFALPAQAVYMAIPEDFTQNWLDLIAGKIQSAQTAEGAKQVLGVKEVADAGETEAVREVLGAGEAQAVKEVLGVKVLGEEETNSDTAQSQPPLADRPVEPAPINQPAPLPINEPMPPQGENNPPSPTCRVNGVEMPGSCEQYNNNGGDAGKMMPQNQPNGGQDQAKNQERMMKDVQRGIKQMETNLKRLESAFKKSETKGLTIPAEAKDRLKEARTEIDAIKAAQTPEAMQEIDLGALNEIMMTLEETNREIISNAQRMDGIKRGIKSMESGLKAFENQIARLVKQKVVIPAETTDNLNKVKTIIAAVKTAKTIEEMEAAGVEDLQEVMQNLDESRGQLEMLARWPQTLKQMDKQLTMLNTQLKKNKTIVDRLAKQGIDLAANYANFAEAVKNLKAARDGAVEKMKNNDSQAAFDAVQDDFFGQMDDVMQDVNVIQAMANLGRFNSDFKRMISQGQSQIRKLKAKKIDSAEAAVILNDINNLGKEIVALIKTKPVDAEAITSALEEMQILNQDFGDKIAELTGEEEVMPWEQGPQQFKQPQMPDNWQQLIPQQPRQPQQPMNTQEPMTPIDNQQ